MPSSWILSIVNFWNHTKDTSKGSKEEAPSTDNKAKLRIVHKLVLGIFVCFPSAIKHHVGKEYPEITHRHHDRIKVGHPFYKSVNFLDTKNWKDDDEADEDACKEVAINEDAFFSTFAKPTWDKVFICVIEKDL